MRDIQTRTDIVNQEEKVLRMKNISATVENNSIFCNCLAGTFSPKTKKGEGKVCSLLEQLVEDLWMSAAFPSVVSTLRFSL